MAADTTSPEIMAPLAAFKILDGLPDPVVLVDGRRRLVAANAAAEELFGAEFIGRDLALALRQPPVLEAARRALDSKGAEAAEISIPAPVARDFTVRAVPYSDDDAADPLVVLVFHDVTAIKKADQLRADFVANVSHELRSPISSLVGFIETLKGAARDDSDARARFLDIMEDEAHRMARLIDDLLSLSRVESEEHVRPQGEANLEDVVGAVADTLSGQAKSRGIEIRIDFQVSPSSVAGSADELREVFQNLIDNAIKYGAEKTVVSVTATSVARIPDYGGPGIAVAVRNQGEGIATEHLPRLTERFYRVDKGRSRQLGGTGLGLAIVKHIVNRHRGRLRIESEIGSGSTFTVYLPYRAPVPAETGKGDAAKAKTG